MRERRTATISLPLEGVSHKVAPDTLVDLGGQHPILERMPESVERVIIALHHPVFPHDLVDGVRQARAVEIPREPVGAKLEGFQTNPHERDQARGMIGFQGTPDRLDADVRVVAIEADLRGPQVGGFAGPIAGVDHAQKDHARLGVEFPQRRVGDDLLLDPPIREGLALLFHLPEVQIREGKGDAELFSPVHEPQHAGEVNEVLVRTVGGQPLLKYALLPPEPEVEHVVGRDLADHHVAADVDKIPDCLLPWILPTPDLVFALALGQFARHLEIETLRLAHRDLGSLRAAKEGGGLDGVETAAMTYGGFHPIKHIVDRQFGDASGVWRRASFTRFFISNPAIRFSDVMSCPGRPINSDVTQNVQHNAQQKCPIG